MPAPQYRKRLERDFFNLIEAMVKILGSKDRYTFHHSLFVMEIGVKLAERFDFEEDRLARMRTASLLHDIGKVGIPYGILNKKERLTEQEFAMIREHPVIGSLMVEDFEQFAGIDRIIRYHHERYDGTGYPSGLAGTDIPLEARLIAVADSYHAMASRRAYKESRDRSYIAQELLRCRGAQFDPEVVDVFVDMIETDPEFVRYEDAYVNNSDWRAVFATQGEGEPFFAEAAVDTPGEAEWERRLEQDFDLTLEMLLFVMKMQEVDIYRHGERVCDLAVSIGGAMALSRQSLAELRIASLLHGIGEIAFIEEGQQEGSGAADDVAVAVASHNILSPMNRFERTARIIRAQWENCDGSGLPDGLSGGEIPIEGAILRVANVAAQAGGFEEAAAELRRGSGVEYRPDVVEASLKVMKEGAG